jgi:hypothetical protein
VSTLCNQEAGQAGSGFWRHLKKRIRIIGLKVFCGVGTLPDYDPSGNTTQRIETCRIALIGATLRWLASPDRTA